MADWDFDLEQIRKNWERLNRGAQRGEAGQNTKAPPSRFDLDLDQIRKNWERLGLLHRQAFMLYYDDLVSSGGEGGEHAPPGGPWPDASALPQDPARASGLAPGEQDADHEGGFGPPGQLFQDGGAPDPARGTTPFRFAPRLDLRDMPARFRQIETPREAHPEAQTLLFRVRMLVHRELAEHEPLLRPFLDRAAEILQRLGAKPAEGEEPVDKKKLGEELDQTFGDLEDMIALVSGIGR